MTFAVFFRQYFVLMAMTILCSCVIRRGGSSNPMTSANDVRDTATACTPGLYPVTYTNDIKPILQTLCVTCHLTNPRNHGAGDWADLTTYANAYALRNKIKVYVGTGYMPYQGSDQAGQITNEIRLTIVNWVNSCAKE